MKNFTKKRTYRFNVLLGLLLIGGICFSFADAQVRNGRRGTKTIRQVQTQKPQPIGRADEIKRIAANMSGAQNRTEGTDPCNTAAPITLGQTLNGTLSVSSCLLGDGTYINFYEFTGTAGQPIYTAMNSSSFDTYLYLLDTDGNIIEENDDSGNSTDSRIPADAGVLTLPYTGTYIIGANSYDPGITGAFTVTLNTDANCAAQNISFNQSVVSTLSTTSCLTEDFGGYYYTDLYKFSGTAGQQITISEFSTNFDAYLILHTPSGDGSVEDDNSGGGTNAFIPTGGGTFVLPETGVYTIEATTFNELTTGMYNLTLTGPNVAPVYHRAFDFDGDGKTDVSVFRPSNGVWYLNQSTNGFAAVNFGLSTDLLAPADFDGDGKTDVAVFRSSNGTWYYLKSSDNSFAAVQFGQNGDLPRPADFDGDGKADLTVFRPSNGAWYRLNSSNGAFFGTVFGQNGDKPLIADYDGDGKSDLAVFRPSTSTFYWLASSNNGFNAAQFGLSTDIPTPGDFDGDGKTDIAVFRPSNGSWYRINSSNGSFAGVQFGANGDIPTTGDYDGDGKSDIAVFRPSTGNWYYTGSSNGGFVGTNFGISTDKPVPSAFQ